MQWFSNLQQLGTCSFGKTKISMQLLDEMLGFIISKSFLKAQLDQYAFLLSYFFDRKFLHLIEIQLYHEDHYHICSMCSIEY